MQRQQTSAVNEVIASILIVALVIALAVIIGGIVFGLIVIQPKSAYIPPEVKVVSYTNGTLQAISLYSRGGDTAYLDKGDNVQYALGVYVDRSEGSFRAKVEDDAGTFNPGQTLYLYYSTSGYRITDDLTGKQILPLPAGSMTLRIVDENARLLVYNQGMTISGGGTVSPTPTCTLGTGWRIWNQDTITHTYILKVEPGGQVLSPASSIPAKTWRYVWFNVMPPYQANLTTIETAESEVRGSGSALCVFPNKDESKPGGSTQSRLQLNGINTIP